MQAIWLFSVSFCLFYNKAIAASSSTQSSDSEIFDAPELNRRTLLKPYLSQYNNIYAGSDTQNKGRRIFNATLKVLVDLGPLVLQKWEGVPRSPRRLEISSHQMSKSDDPPIHNIHRAVSLLLLHKMHNWVHSSNSLESIEYYLGFKTETVDIINMSMTELFSQQREKLINIDDLAQMFYYSCDVKNMTKNDPPMLGSVLVKGRFAGFLEKHGTILTQEFLSLNEDVLVTFLKYNLQSIVEKTYAPFGITVSSMKMLMLGGHPSDDERIKVIQNLETITLNQWPISRYVDSYSKAYKGNTINGYHTKILGVVATYLFGYVRNHFELLSLLRHHGVDSGDKSVIDQFTTFMNAYMSVFIDRYFEFKGEISQQLVDALFLVLYFLDPSDPQIPDVKDLTEVEKSTLNEHKELTFSMDNYFINPEGNDKFDQYMWKMIDYVDQTLIKTFTEEDPLSWNRLLKIQYEEPLNKIILLHHMTTNNKNAINVLEKFASEFTIDKQLYEIYYGLNHTSSSPSSADTE